MRRADESLSGQKDTLLSNTDWLFMYIPRRTTLANFASRSFTPRSRIGSSFRRAARVYLISREAAIIQYVEGCFFFRYRHVICTGMDATVRQIMMPSRRDVCYTSCWRRFFFSSTGSCDNNTPQPFSRHQVYIDRLYYWPVLWLAVEGWARPNRRKQRIKKC